MPCEFQLVYYQVVTATWRRLVGERQNLESASSTSVMQRAVVVSERHITTLR